MKRCFSRLQQSNTGYVARFPTVASHDLIAVDHAPSYILPVPMQYLPPQCATSGQACFTRATGPTYAVGPLTKQYNAGKITVPSNMAMPRFVPFAVTAAVRGKEFTIVTKTSNNGPTTFVITPHRPKTSVLAAEALRTIASREHIQ